MTELNKGFPKNTNRRVYVVQEKGYTGDVVRREPWRVADAVDYFGITKTKPHPRFTNAEPQNASDGILW